MIMTARTLNSPQLAAMDTAFCYVSVMAVGVPYYRPEGESAIDERRSSAPLNSHGTQEPTPFQCFVFSPPSRKRPEILQSTHTFKQKLLNRPSVVC